MQTILQHKLLLIISGIVLAGLVWYGLAPSSDEPDLTSTPSVEGGNSADAGIVPTLLMLRAVKLDGTIFSAPAFARLQDFSTEIVPEPVGRENPFDPLSATQRQSTAATGNSPSLPIFTPAN